MMVFSVPSAVWAGGNGVSGIEEVLEGTDGAGVFFFGLPLFFFFVGSTAVEFG